MTSESVKLSIYLSFRARMIMILVSLLGEERRGQESVKVGARTRRIGEMYNASRM